MWCELQKDYLGQKAGARVELDEDVGKALVSKGIAREAPNATIEELVQKSAQGMLAQFQKELETQVNGCIKQFGDALALSRKGADRRIFGDGGEGDRKKTFGAFLVAVKSGNVKALEE